ncbi:MAG TPA: flippase [Flavobacterium sp.]
MISSQLRKLLTNVNDREIFSKGLIALIIKMLGILASYGFTFLVSKKFGAEGWGLFSLTITCGGFFILIGKFGFDVALLRITSESKAEGKNYKTFIAYKKGVAVLIPLSLILTTLFYTSSSFAAKHIFHKTYIVNYLKLGSLMIFPSVLLLINSEGLRGLKKISQYVFIQNLGYFLFASILLVVFYKYNSPYLPLFVYIVALYMIATYSMVVWWKSMDKTNQLVGYSITMKSLFRLSLPMFLSNAMFIIINWTDTLLIGIFETEKEVGVYNICIKIASIITIPLLAMNSITAPKFAELYTLKKYRELDNLVKITCKTIFFVSLFILISVTLGQNLILNFFGEDFADGGQILLILCLGYFINAIAGPNDILLQMTGHEKVFQKIIIASMVFNISLNLLLIPVWGVLGAATTSMLTMLFWNSITVFYIKKHLNILSIYNPFYNG